MLVHKTREFNIICKVKRFTKHLKEFNNKTGEIHTEDVDCVALIPNVEYTEGQAFLSEWLPDPEKDHNEVISRIMAPIFGVSRLAVCRSDEYVKEHYLFVMTTGVEEKLKNIDGQKVNVVILEPTEENDKLLDTAASISRTASE